jgi:hypothetical protein
MVQIAISHSNDDLPRGASQTFARICPGATFGPLPPFDSSADVSMLKPKAVIRRSAAYSIKKHQQGGTVNFSWLLKGQQY